MSKLALYGGDSVRRDPLPYTRHRITPQDKEFVTLSLGGNIDGGGQYVRLLEDSLCNFAGYDHCITVNSGTSALILAYATALQDYEEIHTTPLTFVATVSGALHTGKKVSLGEIDNDSYTLVTRYEPRIVDSDAIHPSIVPVSYAGYPITNANIVDDAHYLYKDMAHFRDVNVSCISLHPAKHITSGEGGAILTNDGNIAEHCRVLRDHGRVGGKAEVAGYNFRLSSINAALALSQLERAWDNAYRRAEIASKYLVHWADDERITLPLSHEYHAWHLFVIRLNDVTPRKWFMDALKAEGIVSQIHYAPIFSLPIFRNDDRIRLRPNYHHRDEWMATIEQANIYDNIVSIPLFPAMTDEDVQDVMDAVDKVLDNAIEAL